MKLGHTEGHNIDTRDELQLLKDGPLYKEMVPFFGAT